MMAVRGAKPTRTKQLVMEAWLRKEGESHAAMAARIGVSRQRVDVIIKELEKLAKVNAIKSEIASDGENDAATESTMGGLPKTQFDGGSTSAAQFATRDIATQPGALVLFTIEWPERLETPEAIALRHPTLTPDAIRNLATFRLNGTSRAGSWKAIGVEPEIGAEMVREDRGVRRALQWAEGMNELRLSANATKIATSLSPNAVQALSFILERQHSEGWARENVLRVTGELSLGVDVNHILSDPRLILEANRHEAMLQQLEDGEVIDAEFRQLPALGEAPPPLPDSGPEKIDVRPRANPPVSKQGQGGDFRPAQHRKVDGIETEFVDQRAPGGDDRPPF